MSHHNETESPGITLTAAAQTATARYRKESPERAAQDLRLYLDGKGCDGFYYGVTFDQATAEDLTFESLGVKVLVDPQTYRFVQGVTIDWVDDDRGQGYLVENPNGNKFRGKFFKRKAWQEALRNNQENPF